MKGNKNMRKTVVLWSLLLLTVGALCGCGGQTETGGGKPTGGSGISQGTDREEFYFRQASGFYKDGFALEIVCTDADAVVYYTTDGSEPDESYIRYEAPIKLKDRSEEPNVLSAKKGICASGDFIPSGKIDKANVIRAVAYYPDGKRSGIITGTYFVGMERQIKYGDVPILSLFTDPDNLFDYETGIYVLGKTYKDWLAEDREHAQLPVWEHVGNYSGRGREWERPVTVEFFAADGESAFVQDMGIRIMGAASRDSVQKSFRLLAREDYGKKSVKYELIPGNLRADGSGAVKKYKSFVLRNGGNDRDSAKIRDPFIQQLVFDRRFETEQYVPCVVYLDGEYWGLYTLNEDYSDHYIENNYGIDNNNVIVLKRGEIEKGEEKDIRFYEEMYDFITENDMSDHDNYKKAEEMLDMGSFADFCALQLYVFNEDSIFENNNWQMWRVRNADRRSAYSDGKWRMMVYDMDYTCGVYSGGGNYMENNISDVLAGKRKPSVSGDESERPAVDLFLALYKNDDFKKELVLALCDMRNINFETNTVREQLEEVSEDYAKLAPDSFRRFGPVWVVNNPESYYAAKLDEIAGFLGGRYLYFPQMMQGAMKLGYKAKCTLSVSDGEKGAVMVNASGVPISGSFAGYYFPDYDITLAALPADGARFVRWEYENCYVSDDKAREITVSFEGDFSIKAVFE